MALTDAEQREILAMAREYRSGQEGEREAGGVRMEIHRTHQRVEKIIKRTDPDKVDQGLRQLVVDAAREAVGADLAERIATEFGRRLINTSEE